ncbi:lyase family protein [Escherichia coli]
MAAKTGRARSDQGSSAFAADAIGYLDAIVANFSEEDAARIKTIERTTNHDVKAVEYFLKEKVAEIRNCTRFLNSSTLPVLRKISITSPRINAENRA